MGKVYWCLDIYSGIKEENVLSLIKSLGHQENIRVTPVYFLDDEYIKDHGHIIPQQMDAIKEVIQKVMKSHINELSTLGEEVTEPEVVYSPTQTKRALADFAVKYFQENRADMVVLSTHAREGVERAFIGSFTESLLWLSPVPLLVIPPKIKDVPCMENVLYPTDASEKGFLMFRKIIEGPLIKKAKITLYHQVEFLRSSFMSALKEVVGGQSFLSKEEKGESLKTQLGEWFSLARKEGSDVEIIIDHSEERVAEGIIKKSESTSADLIIMPNFISEKKSFFVGSRTLEVIRNSKIPVLIQHFK